MNTYCIVSQVRYHNRSMCRNKIEHKCYTTIAYTSRWDRYAIMRKKALGEILLESIKLPKDKSQKARRAKNVDETE